MYNGFYFKDLWDVWCDLRDEHTLIHVAFYNEMHKLLTKYIMNKTIKLLKGNFFIGASNLGKWVIFVYQLFLLCRFDEILTILQELTWKHVSISRVRNCKQMWWNFIATFSKVNFCSCWSVYRVTLVRIHRNTK